MARIIKGHVKTLFSIKLSESEGKKKHYNRRNISINFNWIAPVPGYVWTNLIHRKSNLEYGFFS